MGSKKCSVTCEAFRAPPLVISTLQAELKKESKAVKAELKQAKDAQKAVKSDQKALETTQSEIESSRAQLQAREDKVAAAQADVKASVCRAERVSSRRSRLGLKFSGSRGLVGFASLDEAGMDSSLQAMLVFCIF